jgi:hypothetical protein
LRDIAEAIGAEAIGAVAIGAARICVVSSGTCVAWEGVE